MTVLEWSTVAGSAVSPRGVSGLEVSNYASAVAAAFGWRRVSVNRWGVKLQHRGADPVVVSWLLNPASTAWAPTLRACVARFGGSVGEAADRIVGLVPHRVVVAELGVLYPRAVLTPVAVPARCAVLASGRWLAARWGVEHTRVDGHYVAEALRLTLSGAYRRDRTLAGIVEYGDCRGTYRADTQGPLFDMRRGMSATSAALRWGVKRVLLEQAFVLPLTQYDALVKVGLEPPFVQLLTGRMRR